jgi:hypothetical protein
MWLGQEKTRTLEEFKMKNVTEGGHLGDLEEIEGKFKILRNVFAKLTGLGLSQISC